MGNQNVFPFCVDIKTKCESMIAVKKYRKKRKKHNNIRTIKRNYIDIINGIEYDVRKSINIGIDNHLQLNSNINVISDDVLLNKLLCAIRKNSIHDYEVPFYDVNQGYYRRSLIIKGYVRLYITKSNNKCIPNDICTILAVFLGGINGDLIVYPGETVTLQSTKENIVYEYNSITLTYGSILTCNGFGWNSGAFEGGSLHIICYGDIIINGYDIDQDFSRNIDDNIRDGDGYISVRFTGIDLCGKGHICGHNESNRKYTVNDNNDNFSVLTLGEGGQLLANEPEYNGGGALKIECYGNLIMKNGIISCNGDGNSFNSGNGGSISITLNSIDNLKMDRFSFIEAIGINKLPSYVPFQFGSGIIKLKFLNNNKKYHSGLICYHDYIYNIKPKPCFN